MAAVISWRNAAEAAGASLSVSSEAPGLGVRSLLSETIGDVWRSGVGGSAPVGIALDLGRTVPIRLAAIAAPRDGVLPGAGAQWQVAISSAGAFGSNDVHDSGVVPLDMHRGTAGMLLPPGLAGRYVSVVLFGASGDPYLQLGRIWIGDALVTGRAVAYGWGRGAQDAGGADRAPISGVSNAQPGATGRTLEFDLPLLTAVEAERMDDAALALGTTRQGFVAPFAGLAFGMFGKFTAPPAPTQPRHAWFSARIAFQEDL